MSLLKTKRFLHNLAPGQTVRLMLNNNTDNTDVIRYLQHSGILLEPVTGEPDVWQFKWKM